MTTIQEVFPDAPPVCAGCGNEVDPTYAHWTTDYRQLCALCAKLPRWKALLKKPLTKRRRGDG